MYDNTIGNKPPVKKQNAGNSEKRKILMMKRGTRKNVLCSKLLSRSESRCSAKDKIWKKKKIVIFSF